MILVIGDKKYPGVSIDELSLRHVMALQRELVVTNISEAKTLADVQAMLAEFAALPKDERENHPEAPFLTAVTIWAARVTAGEELGLLEAVDFPARTKVLLVKEPNDKAPAGKAQAPRGAKRRK